MKKMREKELFEMNLFLTKQFEEINLKDSMLIAILNLSRYDK